MFQKKSLSVLKQKILQNSFFHFIIIFFGISYYAFTQTMLGSAICPFCGAPLIVHPITASLAIALGIGTASIVIVIKKISQKISTFFIQKK